MDHRNWAELSGVSKRFGKVVALNGLDLEVRKGELLAILGPNGAGKTTAISLLLGLQKPDTGSAYLFGAPPTAIEARRNVGLMMQEAALTPELRVREHIDLVASYYPEPLSASEAMRLSRVESLGGRPYGKLSGGEKRQVQFAIAICGRPKLLFLDEPTVGLDVQSRQMIWSCLRHLVNEGSSIVLTTHYLEEAEALADRVAVLAKGRLIASGSINEMRSLVVKKYVSCTCRVPVEQVRSWAEVESANRDHRGLRICTRNAEIVVRKLLAADDDLTDLEVHRAGLAQAFAELTEEHIQ